MAKKLERCIPQQLADVLLCPRVAIIDTEDLVLVPQESFAKMADQNPPSAGDRNSLSPCNSDDPKSLK